MRFPRPLAAAATTGKAGFFDEIPRPCGSAWSPAGASTPGNTNGATPLGYLVRRQDAGVVAWLLEMGADPRARDRMGWTPLHVAALYGGGAPTMVTLLEAGADPNARSTAAFPGLRTVAGDTPLQMAAGARDDEPRVTALLEAGADPDAANTEGQTPLHRAAEARHPANVQALLDAGADADRRNDDGNTPLHLVVTYDRRSARSTSYYARGLNPSWRPPPEPAPPHGAPDPAEFVRDTALVGALVRAGANLDTRNDRGETPLGRAVTRGSPPLVDKLLELGADPEPGVDPSAETLPPVCDWGRYDLFAVAPAASLRGCLEAGADVHVRAGPDETPLHTLMRQLEWNGAFAAEAIAALLDAGADVDARDRDGATPLHRAAGTPTAVTELLAGGADVNADDGRGGTPLHHAALANRTESVRVLLEAGADVDARHETGATALHSAAGHWGPPATVDLLVEACADVNARDENGETPLHRAITNGNPAVVRRLLELGADRTRVDSSGTVADPADCRLWPSPVFFAGATAAHVAECLEAGAEVASGRGQRYFGTGSGRLVSYPDGSNPLHMAATWTRDPAVITLLARAGADVGARNQEYSSPMDHHHAPLDHAARDNPDPAVIAALVAAGAEVNAWSAQATPLHEAAGNANPEVAVALLEAGARMDLLAAGGRTPLHRAAAENANPAIIGELASRGADVNARLPAGRTPLHEAAAKNPNPAVVVALVEAGAEVDARGTDEEVWANSLSDAFDFTNPWGQDRGLPPRMGIRTPLPEAAVGNSNPAVVQALIEAGADVHARADIDWHWESAATPLYWAAAVNPDPAVPRLLVQAGADVNASAGSGLTPLHIAALRNPAVFPMLPGTGRRSRGPRPAGQDTNGLCGPEPVAAGNGGGEAVHRGRGERAGIGRGTSAGRLVLFRHPGFLAARPARRDEGPMAALRAEEQRSPPLAKLPLGNLPNRCHPVARERPQSAAPSGPFGCQPPGRYFAGIGCSSLSCCQKIDTTHQRVPSYSSWNELMPRAKGSGSLARRARLVGAEGVRDHAVLLGHPVDLDFMEAVLLQPRARVLGVFAGGDDLAAIHAFGAAAGGAHGGAGREEGAEAVPVALHPGVARDDLVDGRHDRVDGLDVGGVGGGLLAGDGAGQREGGGREEGEDGGEVHGRSGPLVSRSGRGCPDNLTSDPNGSPRQGQ